MRTGCALISRVYFFVTTPIHQAEEYPKFFPSMCKASLYSLMISINCSWRHISPLAGHEFGGNPNFRTFLESLRGSSTPNTGS